MKFLRLPATPNHSEIHSVDVNAANTKVITGGRDGTIQIWNTSDLERFSQSQKQPDSDPAQSSSDISKVEPVETLKHHNSSLVNNVRWSPKNPETYVSGDADGNVFLGSELVYPFPSIDSSKIKPVVDLSWSHDGRLIAWSTTDGKTNVLDVEKRTFQEVSVLTHLETPVIQRSVAFDPTNNYLITLGDDTLIYLYQYAYEDGNYRFRLINKISRLINKHPLNVHYKRISWSPDGELVSIPTASKNQTSLISLIARSKNWNNRISLVGHGLTCEVVKFNPKIFNSSQTDNDNIYNVLATAGSDRTLAVWNTSKDTPIFLLQEVVEKPITDICWNHTGTSLYVSSLDGFLGILAFDENELGYKVSSEVVTELERFEREFVKPLNHKYDHEQPTNKRSTGSQIEILDQKDAISIDKKVEVGITKEPAKDIKEASPSEEETKPKGKIVPEIIPPPSMEEPEVASSDILQSAMSNRQAKAIATKSKPAPQKETPNIDIDKQKTTTKNGKRRIQPLLISNGTKVDTLSSKVSDSIPNGNGASTNTSAKSLMDFEKPSYSVSNDFYKENKRLKSQEEANGTNGSTSVKRLKRDLEPVKFIGSPIVNPNTAFSKIRLSAPKVRLSFQLHSKLDDEVFVLDIKNGTGNETKPSRITYFKKDKQIWCDFIPRYLQLAVEGSLFWALSTSDGQILTYSHTSGKRLLPPIVLGSPISFLESHTKYLMAVTSLGELYVWNLAIKKIELNTTLAPLLELNNKYQEDGLSKSDNITMCAITSLGIPLVTLSNGSGYLFNKDLGIWQTITESWWSFGSHFWDSSDDNSKLSKSSLFSDDASIIELLEHKTNEEIIRKTRTGRGKYFNKISKNMIMKEGFENLENTISISHLENKILCCELLGENTDFHRYFITYVKRICELGFKTKLFEVCDHLLGPHQDDEDDEDDEDDQKQTEESEKWDPTVCGFNKHELLKEVIMVCAKNRDAQRVLLHFGNKIGVEGLT